MPALESTPPSAASTPVSARAHSGSVDPALRGVPVVCVSHGFQTNYERGFCNGLAANGASVTLISSDRSDAAGLDPRIQQLNLRGSQEESRPRWRKAANMLRYYVGLLAYSAWRRRANLHVIGLLHPPLTNGVLLGLWFRLWSWRYVLTVHNLLPHDRHTPQMHRLYRWAYRLPHRLVVHTARMGQELQTRFGVPPHKVVVMEHGLEPLRPEEAAAAGLTPAGEAGPSTARDPNAPVRLLVFGKVAPYKGVDLLLDAMRLYTGTRPLKLLIAGGGGSSAYGKTLRQMIAAHPLRSAITWRDEFIPEEEMPALFGQSDIVVLPYRHIDQSGVFFQALRFGVPILATPVGEFQSYISPAIGEVAATATAEELASALLKIAGRVQKLNRYDVLAQSKNYEWVATSASLTRVYA